MAQDTSRDLTRQEWKTRIQEARRRVDILRKEHKLAPPAPTIGRSDEESTQRVVNDDSLEVGDIVSFRGGLYRFNGRSNSDDRLTDFTYLEKAGQGR